MNPKPVALKMEKVYLPCFLLTKKRYVGYSYERPDQEIPVFDAKGIETVRRDSCPAVAKILEQSIRIMFESKDISKVRSYVARQWTWIFSGRISLQDFIFAKEVRLGSYRARTSSSLSPAAVVAMKAMRSDPRAEPQYGERVPYVVVHGEPGSRLIDMVVDPSNLLSANSPYRLNESYYINKQIVPTLQRVFGLVGTDLNRWLAETPRLSVRLPFLGPVSTARNIQAKRSRIDRYYAPRQCDLCGCELKVHSLPPNLCDNCASNGPVVARLVGRTSRLEKEFQHLTAICQHCCADEGGQDHEGGGERCASLACSVFFERRKVQKDLQSASAVATSTGTARKCLITD